VKFDDADLGVDWGGIWNSADAFTVSAKDQIGQAFATFKSPFTYGG
jgi:hypothetical protein